MDAKIERWISDCFVFMRSALGESEGRSFLKAGRNTSKREELRHKVGLLKALVGRIDESDVRPGFKIPAED